ncbi:MAG: hypothetical protein EP343_25600 [Deltaproteobacteria bacterium]|nr:MAG: hypothetical protein EP343_25600 [Deltaproteobacteria bacterium]
MKAKSILVLLALCTLPLVGCKAMMEAYRAQLRSAVSLSTGVKQSDYRKVGVQGVSCRSSEKICPKGSGASFANAITLSLSSLGYQVFDRATFVKIVKVVVPPPAPPVDNPDDGRDSSSEASQAADAYEPNLMYDEIPQAKRVQIIKKVESNGVKGVVSGRMTIGAPDSVTKFRKLTVLLKLSDLQTGRMIWIGRWEQNVFESNQQSIQSAIDQAAQNLSKALKMKLDGLI